MIGDPIEAALASLVAAGLAPEQLGAARLVLRELVARTFDDAASVANPARGLSASAALTVHVSHEERRIAGDLARRAQSFRPAPPPPPPAPPAPTSSRRSRLQSAIAPKPRP